MPEITIKHDANELIVGIGSDAVEASRQAGLAAASAAYAESMTGPTYASTAAGLSATTDGQGFAVDNGDGTVTVYLNSAGVAVEQRTLATKAVVDTKASSAELASVASRIAIDGITAGLGMVIQNDTRQLGAFSVGGSFGVGDFSDGVPINQHAGDDGTTTRVITVRAETAPLFMGVTNRPNGEAGGDIGRSIVSFEGWRQANDAGYQDMGGVRVISEGTTVGRYGGRVAILTRPNGVTTVADFRERFAVHANGNVHITGPNVNAAATANRTGQAADTTVLTVSGKKSVVEIVTGAADTSGLNMGDLLFVHNLNTAGEKRLVALRCFTAGATANDRGGLALFQVKADGGPTDTVWTATGDGLQVNKKFACNNAAPQAAYPVSAEATDLASAIALVNELRAALRNNGICS